MFRPPVGLMSVGRIPSLSSERRGCQERGGCPRFGGIGVTVERRFEIGGKDVVIVI